MAMTPETRVPRKKDRTHWLYIAVIAAVVLGAAIGLIAPEAGIALKPLGTAFVALIKMIIAPIIFCTIVLGVGSVAKAATVGKVGGLALIYFLVMATFALVIGLVVGNLVHPGSGLDLKPYDAAAGGSSGGAVDFLLSLIPGDIPVLPTLVLALLVGFALQSMGKAGEPVLTGIRHIQAVVFKLMMDDHVGCPDRRVRSHRGGRGGHGLGGHRLDGDPYGGVLPHVRGVHRRRARRHPEARHGPQHLRPH